MPLIALIVAVAIRAGERRPRRREFLKTWAVISGAWLCTGWIVGLLAFGLLSGGTGGGAAARAAWIRSASPPTRAATTSTGR